MLADEIDASERETTSVHFLITVIYKKILDQGMTI